MREAAGISANSQAPEQRLPTYLVEGMLCFKTKQNRVLIALFLTFCSGNAPTATASDGVNERHKQKKVNMTNKQWDNHGGTKVTLEDLKETAPSARESACDFKLSAF